MADEVHQRDARYDVVIVGAGPAGLSAGRTAARLGFSTLVLERLNHPGELRHPCNGVITPVPGFVPARRLLDGFFVPSVDLLIPSSLIIGYPPTQKVFSPGGYRYEASFDRNQTFPAAVVDKPGLLRLMARQAESAGAELRFGKGVTGLLAEEGRVHGVRVGQETIRSKVVISAEGSGRRLCQAAGIGPKEPPKQYVVLINQDLEAPNVRAEDVGQIFTTGRRYTSAQQAFGMVVMPTAGRASIFFTVYVEAGQALADPFIWFYLDEYVQTDPRVRELLAGSRVLGRTHHTIALHSAPDRVVTNGFLGVGDAITPAGHLGILPSIYMGRQAAFMIAEALDAGSVSAEALAPYDQMLHESILPNLEAEARLMLGLTRMGDEEIDRLCQALGGLNVPVPLFSNWRTLAWEMIGWMVRKFPALVYDWQLFQGTTQGSATAPQI